MLDKTAVVHSAESVFIEDSSAQQTFAFTTCLPDLKTKNADSTVGLLKTKPDQRSK